MKYLHNKGFTLIELLVVIAIIGILASVVMVAVGSARAKSADAAIKGNVDSIRKEAELYYNDELRGNGSYGGTFAAAACAATAETLFADPLIEAQYTAAAAASTLPANCVSDDDEWAVAVPLKSDANIAWCVDNAGVAKEVTDISVDLGFAGNACK